MLQKTSALDMCKKVSYFARVIMPSNFNKGPDKKMHVNVCVYTMQHSKCRC